MTVFLSMFADDRVGRSRRGCRTARAPGLILISDGPQLPASGGAAEVPGRPATKPGWAGARGQRTAVATSPAGRAARRGRLHSAGPEFAGGQLTVFALRPHCQLPSGRGGNSKSCVASDSTGNKRGERRGEAGREGGKETGALPLAPREHPPDADGEPLPERRPFLWAPFGPPVRQVSWEKKNKAPSQGRQRSRGAPGDGRAEAEAPGALPSPRAPPARARSSASPHASQSSGKRFFRRDARPRERKWWERGEAGGGAAAGSRGGGGGRGAGAPQSCRVGPGTDCHPAAISLCHGSGLLATAAGPAAPSRASRRRRGLNSTRRSPARGSHTKRRRVGRERRGRARRGHGEGTGRRRRRRGERIQAGCRMRRT